MATITPTSTINPATMAANWTTGVGQSGAKWLNKYLNPKAAFNADPTGSQTKWMNGVNAAIARNAYSKGLGKADLTMAANNATAFGQSNYSSAGARYAAKYAAKTTGLAAAMTALRATVNAMDASTLEARIAKSAAWARGLAALRGTF
jgi:hypothetical protein